MTERDSEGRVLALNGTFIEVLDKWQNVGPILDAVLADPDGSGQVNLVSVDRFRFFLKATAWLATDRDCFRGHEHR